MPRGPNEELEYELGPETEIDSAPSSLLQVPSNERDEGTEEGEQENDDTLIPDTNDLNDQTESAGEITYTPGGFDLCNGPFYLVSKIASGEVGVLLP